MNSRYYYDFEKRGKVFRNICSEENFFTRIAGEKLQSFLLHASADTAIKEG